MFRIFNSLAVCLMTLVTLTSIQAQDAQTSTWKGPLNAGETKLRLELDITDNAGTLTGEMRSLDQGNATMKLVDLKIDDEKLSFSIPQIGAKFNGELSKDGTVAEGTFTQGPAKFPLAFTRSDTRAATADEQMVPEQGQLKEAWVGKLNMGLMETVMQFRIVMLENGDSAAYFDSVTEGRTDFEATWSIDGDTLKFDVEPIKLSYSGTLNESRDAAEGTWNQGGRKLPLTLKMQTTPCDNVNVWENRPQRPVAPFPYDAEEVVFENKADNVSLAGTLTIPRKAGRHPVVILISGSGPQDRDESLMEHKPFLVLADYLSRRGIAVLRYDDRGTAESTGEFGPATTEDFARDASAAVEFLKNHDRINPMEIGLAGHSEGGLIAPLVVGLRDDVAFVVLLAATGVDGATISISQSEAMARAAGVDEAEIAVAMAVNRAVIGIAAKAKPGEDFSEELKTALEEVIQTIPESEREESGNALRAEIELQMDRLQGNWIPFFLSHDPRPALKNIKCPVLAVIGTKDKQVLPDLNMPEIEKALTEGGNKDFEIVRLEGLNHLFQECETGALSEYVSIQETFNSKALATIGDWIIERTTPIK